MRFSTALIDLEEDDDGVTATLRDEVSGKTETVRCRYLAGCDGGGSTVRTVVGIGLDGEFGIMPRFMTHFRTDDAESRRLLQRSGRTWHHQSVHGTLIAQNDVDTWTLHTRYPANEADATRPEALVARFVGHAIPMEILVANPWTPHLAVARSAGTKRVLLAGDAGHLYIPTGGYGMNTGIGDAYGLGWMLAAVLRGFAGPGLLEAYERERLPVWQRNLAGSQRHDAVRVEIAARYGPALQHEGPEAPARASAAARIAEIGNAENESHGIEFGYHYAGSPAIATEAGATPPDDPVRYVPTTLPGGRLPSVYLSDGRAVYDDLGPWFTVLAGEGADTSPLEGAAQRRSLPLEILRHSDRLAREVCDARIVLVRPDQHVAWRGNELPARGSAVAVLDRALGWLV